MMSLLKALEAAEKEVQVQEGDSGQTLWTLNTSKWALARWSPCEWLTPMMSPSYSPCS